MAERVVSLEEKIKQQQRDSLVTKANGLSILGTLATFTAVLIVPGVAPAALGFDILTNVGGEKVKEWNDKRIENKVRGSNRIAQDSRMAKIEERAPTPIRANSRLQLAA